MKYSIQYASTSVGTLRMSAKLSSAKFNRGVQLGSVWYAALVTPNARQWAIQNPSSNILQALERLYDKYCQYCLCLTVQVTLL